MDWTLPKRHSLNLPVRTAGLAILVIPSEGYQTGDTFRLLDPESIRRVVRGSSICVVVLANIDRSTAAHPAREEVGELVTELALLTVGLIVPDPEGNRDSYGAREPQLINGLKERVQDDLQPGGFRGVSSAQVLVREPIPIAFRWPA